MSEKKLSIEEKLKIKKDMLSLEAYLTGDFSKIYQHYVDNPPGLVLDDDGVRHIKEVLLPAKYKLAKCQCKIVHPLESDTWYHKGLLIDEVGLIGVYRACKTCGDILSKELDDAIS